MLNGNCGPSPNRGNSQHEGVYPHRVAGPGCSPATSITRLCPIHLRELDWSEPSPHVAERATCRDCGAKDVEIWAVGRPGGPIVALADAHLGGFFCALPDERRASLGMCRAAISDSGDEHGRWVAMTKALRSVR